MIELKTHKLNLTILFILLSNWVFSQTGVNSASDSCLLDLRFGIEKYSKTEYDRFPDSIFSYNILCDSLIKSTQLAIYAASQMVSSSNSGMMVENYEIGNLAKFKICQSQSNTRSKKNLSRSYIKIGKRKYYLIKLFDKNEVKDSPISITSSYKILFNDKIYLLLFLTYYNGSSYTNKLFKPIVFDITSIDNAFQIKVPGYVETFSPLCFGDFDNNGILDYAHFVYSIDTKLEVYSMTNGKFISNTKYYLLLRNIDGYLLSIDKKHSFWTGKHGETYKIKSFHWL